MIKSWVLLILLVLSGVACGHLSSEKESVVVKSPLPESLPGQAVMQGVSGKDWVRINVLRTSDQSLSYSYSVAGITMADLPPSGTAAIRGIVPSEEVLLKPLRSHSWVGSAYIIDEFQINKLRQNQDYSFFIKAASGELIDQRTFQTILANAEGDSFAVVSCSDDRYPEQKEMWESLSRQEPEWILAIGDNSYADSERKKGEKYVSPEVVWRRYAETRNRLQIFRQKKLIPMVALWDDHDFGMNNGGRYYPFRNEVKKVFQAFYPQADQGEGFQVGPGVSSLWKIGPHSFYLLDARSFRSEGGPSPACLKNRTHSLCKDQSIEVPKEDIHLGTDQEIWLLNALREDQNSQLWLAKGDQWLGAYQPFESFDARHPKSFSRTMKMIKSAGKQVVLLSGDRHSSEVTRVPSQLLGYDTYEIVSSPIHAKVYPSNWIDFPNPDQVAGTAEAFNFTVISSRRTVAREPWNLKVLNLKKGEQKSFSLDLMISPNTKTKKN